MNPKDKYGRTPLHYAAERGHYDAFEKILTVCCRRVFYDNQRFTPFDLAKENNHLDICDLIEDYLEIKERPTYSAAASKNPGTVI